MEYDPTTRGAKEEVIGKSTEWRTKKTKGKVSEEDVRVTANK